MEQELIEAVQRRRSKIRPPTTIAPSDFEARFDEAIKAVKMVNVNDDSASDDEPRKQFQRIPPPPPLLLVPPLRVDMTPVSMRGERSEGDLPHFDAVVHPSIRAMPMHRPTSTILRDTKSKLKRTPPKQIPIRDSSPDSQSETALDRSPTQYIPLRRSPHKAERSDARRIDPPSATANDKGREMEEAIQAMNRNQAMLAKALAKIDTLETIVDSHKRMMDEPSVNDYLVDEPEQVHDSMQHVREWSSKVKDGPPPSIASRPPSILKDKERRSKPSAPQRRKSDPQVRSSKLTRLSESEAEDDAKSVRSSYSATSVARSMKSVLFTIGNAEDVRSEISDDDAVKINLDDEHEINAACEKFTIHGPYIDGELNIFHEICQEYTNAAKITFARKSLFSRTTQAYERVYAFIGSDKRSRLANRKDWNSINNDFKLLDHLFRSIIRSRTRKIKEPTLKLEHFTKGKVLHVQRFRYVMKRIFDRRNHLLESLVGTTLAFETIV